MRTTARSALMASLMTLWVISPEMAMAQCEKKILASDGQDGDNFGSSIDIAGNVAVVGIPLATIGSNWLQGMAIVYRYAGSTWQEEQRLIASDGDERDHFGWSVALSGDAIVISAEGDDVGASPFQGSAYVYRYDGSSWQPEQKLTASDGVAYDYFGTSAAIDTNTIVVGAADSYGDGGGPEPGAAYVFRFNGSTWIEQQKLTASDAAAYDHFGWSADVDNDVIVVGARYDDSGANANQGSAYVYRFGTSWREEAKLTASDGGYDDQFGYSIAVDGDVIVVGAPYHDGDMGIHQGSAYLFRYAGSTWSEEQILLPTDAQAYDIFGVAAAARTGEVLIGAVGKDVGDNSSQGAAYLFREAGGGWTQDAEFTASDGEAVDQFGAKVAIDAGLVASSAISDDIGPNADQGSAYIFSLLRLVIDPPVVSQGATLSFDVGLGEAGSPVLLALVDVNGWPRFTTIASGFFDPNGHWTLSATVPGGLGGLVAGFQAFGIDPCGAVQETGEESVTFQ